MRLVSPVLVQGAAYLVQREAAREQVTYHFPTLFRKPSPPLVLAGDGREGSRKGRALAVLVDLRQGQIGRIATHLTAPEGRQQRAPTPAPAKLRLAHRSRQRRIVEKAGALEPGNLGPHD
jgi:hypothetical protein